jgi:hypothetical protein
MSVRLEMAVILAIAVGYRLLAPEGAQELSPDYTSKILANLPLWPECRLPAQRLIGLEVFTSLRDFAKRRHRLHSYHISREPYLQACPTQYERENVIRRTEMQAHMC